MHTLDSQPEEILSEIFSHLSSEEAAKVGSVNKLFKKVSENDLFWKKKFAKHFPHVFSKLKNTEKILWRDEFRKTYQSEYAGLSTFIKKFFSLVKENDIEATKIPLNLIDEIDKNGVSLLDWAQKKKHQLLLNDIYEKAIEHYSSLPNAGPIQADKQDEKGRTLLHWAIFCNQLEATALLISKGYNLNARLKTEAYLYPIHIACRGGFLDIVKLLLGEQPNSLNLMDECGQTPILWAASQGHSHIVRHLAELGADLNKYTQNFTIYRGYTALHWAAKNGDSESVKTLLDHHVALSPVDDIPKHPIHVASINGHLDIVKLLIQNQPSLINEQDQLNQTPVLWAASQGQAHIVRYLAEQGADLTLSAGGGDYLYQCGDTALHWAAEKGYTDVLQVLIDHHVPLDIPANNNGDMKQAIHIACLKERLEIVKLLLEEQPRLLNQPDNFGQTPLMCAIFQGSTQIVRYLLDKEADLNLRTSHQDLTALHLAAINAGSPEIIKLLLAKGASVDALDARGNTPLHLAIKNNQLACIRELIKYKSDINIVNKEGKKPLDYVNEKIRLEIELLLYAPNFKNELSKPSNNAFSLFNQYIQTTMLPATKALKKVMFDGADPSTLNDYSETLTHSEFQPLYQRAMKK